MRNYGRNLSSVLLASVVIYLGMLPATESWGIDGHHAICKITESLLSDEASMAVKDLLHDDLDSLCSCADQVRFRYPWASPLHYIDTPVDKCTYQYSNEGGNTIELCWYTRSSNLHSVWDNLIIETGLKDYYDRGIEELITALQENITGTWSDEVPT